MQVLAKAYVGDRINPVVRFYLDDISAYKGCCHSAPGASKLSGDLTVYISSGEKTKMPSEYESDRRFMNQSVFDYANNSNGLSNDTTFDSDIKTTGFSDPKDMKVIE